ncbi:unnamed protein product [Spirodela intermedia]|uniref:E2 ubiquitin-conjugating enzyme n=1 Tax=Spirodela intermedia TaxID=51605 RepID=A0A7I8JAQ7_SPIIN|nr:unnamed protein product [Spirodela intermedia]CAA6667286.1 unnamed protein product [Spirodela intermedia]
MAHAVRLNLRMQKELKLLLSDPPPGVSLLPNSDDGCSTSSLSNIEARIKGPEGTVYDKGIFHVRVQIPERYPFQPPNVTFVTPVYHPNIDNGGRICLDILNLPPKGAWQPSLNISTVLTSIVILLSEPNPDDGLMCETSREYKYNRQQFDQKARSWTEKYAKVGTDVLKNYDVVIRPRESLCFCQLSLSSSRSNLSEATKPVSHQDSMNGAEIVPMHKHKMDGSRESEEEVYRGSKIMEAIVVSDSEESEEDNRPTKFRLSLGRQRRAEKWKVEKLGQ